MESLSFFFLSFLLLFFDGASRALERLPNHRQLKAFSWFRLNCDTSMNLLERQRERDRQTEREREREGGRETDRQTDRQTQGQTETNTETETERD